MKGKINGKKTYFFYGRVQGVGFRWHAVSKARLLGLTGWVRNLSDGSVEMEVQGTQTRIGELLGYLYEQRYIRIEDIKSEDMELKEESSFRERW